MLCTPHKTQHHNEFPTLCRRTRDTVGLRSPSTSLCCPVSVSDSVPSWQSEASGPVAATATAKEEEEATAATLCSRTLRPDDGRSHRRESCRRNCRRRIPVRFRISSPKQNRRSDWTTTRVRIHRRSYSLLVWTWRLAAQPKLQFHTKYSVSFTHTKRSVSHTIGNQFHTYSSKQMKADIMSRSRMLFESLNNINKSTTGSNTELTWN